MAGKLSALLVVAALSAAAQASLRAEGSDLAERTYRNAEQLMRDGKLDQAVKDYRQVAQSFPDSAWADNALLALGSIYYPTDSVWDLGKVDLDAQEKGRSYFEQVRERYAQTESAPHALYKMGLLALEPFSPHRNLDEAYASFLGVVNIYPGRGWTDPSLLGAAVAEIGKQDYDHAILALERALETDPHGRAAAESQYFLGLANARAGSYVAAAEAFQAARLEGGDTPAAGRALQWLTLLYNVRLRELQGGKYQAAHDAGFVPRPAAGEDLRGVSSMAVSPSGDLVVADSRLGAVLTFEASGKAGGRAPLSEASFVGFDAAGKPVRVGEGGLTIAGKPFPAARRDGDQTRPIERIGWAWRSETGKVFVLDLEEGQVLRYDGPPDSPAVVNDDKQARTRIIGAAVGPSGRLILLDAKGRQILVAGSGAPAPLPGTAGGDFFRDPAAVAVDHLGDIYVLDDKLKAVVILNPDGREIGRIAPAAGSLGELESPAALAVGPRGEVYVYDKRKRTILRFQ